MTRARLALAAAGVATVVGGAACKQETEFAGVGPWHVKKTKLRDASGRCQPTDLPDGREGSWCFGQPALRVGGQDASIDLYFGGTEPAAAVIEIQLQFRGCREEPLEAWVRKNFGDPYDQRDVGLKGRRWFLRNRGAFIIAELPTSPGRCTIRLMPRSEEAEVERLRADPPAPTTPAPVPTPAPAPAPAP